MALVAGVMSLARLGGGPAPALAADSGWQVQRQEGGNNPLRVNDIAFVDADHGWAAANNLNDAGALSTDDGGQSWIWRRLRQDYAPEENAVSIVDAGHVWMGGSRYGAGTSAFDHTSDGGSTWQGSIDNSVGDVFGLVMLTADHGFAAATLGNLWRTDDAGSSWTEALNPDLTNLHGVAFAGADHGWTAGCERPTANDNCDVGVVYATSNGGAAWSGQSVPSGTGALTEVWFLDASHGFALGPADLLGTDDGGTTWRTLPAPSSGMTSVRFATRERGWVAAQASVFGTSDGGATWAKETTAAAGLNALGVVYGNGVAHVWAGGLSGLILAHTESVAPDPPDSADSATPTTAAGGGGGSSGSSSARKATNTTAAAGGGAAAGAGATSTGPTSAAASAGASAGSAAADSSSKTAASGPLAAAARRHRGGGGGSGAWVAALLLVLAAAGAGAGGLLWRRRRAAAAAGGPTPPSP